MVKNFLVIIDEQYPSSLSVKRGSCGIDDFFDDWVDEHPSSTIKNVQVQTYISQDDGCEYNRCFLWIVSEVDEHGSPIREVVE